MELSTTAIARFFRAFELNSSARNFPALVSQFADVFLAAGPQGVQCVRAADFAIALPKRKQLFDSLGCRSTSLVSLLETQVSERFVMAKTQWKMTFVRDPGHAEDVLAESVFIVDTAGEDFKIVFYLAHQDHITLLKERGILPA
jgi:hypothetical protein